MLGATKGFHVECLAFIYNDAYRHGVAIVGVACVRKQLNIEIGMVYLIDCAT